MTKVICIVDAYSTGKNLATAFKAKGYTCIHVKSSPLLPSHYKHHAEDFVANIDFTDDIDRLLTQLKQYGETVACIPGYESGVELADLLSEKLNLTTNGSESSALRRNKYAMTEAVKAAGLAIMPHIKSNSFDEIAEWAKAQWNETPEQSIVLKPLESANGDHVFFCHNSTDLKEAFNKITTSTNQFGQNNLEVLAENFNPGLEYIVNTVSWEGQHYLVEMWRIIRIPQTTIYDKAEIMRQQDTEWKIIEEYTFKVLDALKIRYGAGTTELKYTPEGGPILLETSARLMSGSNLEYSDDMMGYSQLSLLVESYHAPKDFLKRINLPSQPYKGYGMDVLLISTNEGILQYNIIDEIKKLGLNSFHSAKCIQKGDKLYKTVQQDSTPGEIFLKSSKKDVLEQDYLKIRKWEKSFYQQAVLLNKPQNPIPLIKNS